MEDFKDIAAIDAALDEEYKEFLDNEPKDEDEITEEVVEDTTLDSKEVIEEQEDNVEEIVEEEEDEDVEEVVKVDKKEYAFKQLRQQKELAEAKSKAFNDMAISLGYKDGDALLASHKAKQVNDEAVAKGVDPKFYKEFNDVKEELAETRKVKLRVERQVKVDKFIGALNEVAESNGLSAEEKQGIINQLGEDGYSMDDIVAIKAPKKLIRGYISDRIVKSKVQEKIKTKQSKAGLEEEKISSAVVKKDDWRDEIHKELEIYAKENNLYFED